MSTATVRPPEELAIEAAHPVDVHDLEPRGFIRRYVFSTDHKVIGIQYILTGLLMAILGAALAALIRLQLGWPDHQWPLLARLLPAGYPSGVMTPEFYLAVVTMHGTIMVFFFISYVLVSGFGNYLVPLQVGARDMAFPFLNMLSYWVGLLSALVLIASFFVEGGAAASGWTAYPPLSAVATAVPGSHAGQSIWLLSMALFIASFTMSGLNIVATVLSTRAPGLWMMRLSLTVWSYFIASILGLLAFPPLTAGAIMLLLDRHFGTSFFLPSGLIFGNKVLPNTGGSPLLWQHLFWFLGHPEVYVLILPALGIACDIIPAFTRKPVFGYRISVWCLMAVGCLSMIVWGHHMFVSGMSPFSGEYFSLVTLTITVPMTIFGVNMLASLWGANLQLKTPLLFSLGVLALFGSGGFGGLFLGNATADMQLHDTYFVVGHFHMMIGGVTLLGTFGAIYFWFPKMFGRTMNETLGKVHFWFTFFPFFTIFFMQHFLGLQGAPRRYYAFSAYDYLQKTRGQNLVISITAMLLISAQLLFLVNFVWSLFKGRKAAANPWHATTLEWTVASPPPHGNFGTIPVVERWAYEYGVVTADGDFATQIVASRQIGDRMTIKTGNVGVIDRDTLLREDQVRLGLWMFLGTVTMLFAAFTSAYVVRRSGSDWRPSTLPALLWVNTAVLAASSLALEIACWKGLLGRWRTASTVCVGALALGLAFLGGQAVAWRQMVAAGMYLSSNPYSAFVYMMTGAHAVHIVAALVVLTWGTAVTWRGSDSPRVWAARMELCRTFWHYLGGVWIFLFALISLY